MRAIWKLMERPDESIQRGLSLRRFAVCVLYVLTYAPDRESSGSFKRLREELEQHFQFANKLEEALEREFLKQLYVERVERQEIVSMIPAMRPVLVHGLPGVGKTVVLKKSKADLDSASFKFIYFDLKAIAETIEAMPSDEFPLRFREFIYGKIHGDYVANSESLLKEWRIFKIQNDSAYAAFREWLLDLVQHPLLTTRDWENELSQDPARQKYQSLDVRGHDIVDKFCGSITLNWVTTS
ncbi:MAG: hypothetical protein HY872_08880 [Chloroflexi bacterium]|nr:hypothetical protein [Chloroflexota bacterium]